MGVHPTKPRYTCANCLYGDKPREVPCTVCPVPDKPTERPKQWKPKVDMSEWNPVVTESREIGNTTTSPTRDADATETRFDNKDGRNSFARLRRTGGQDTRGCFEGRLRHDFDTVQSTQRAGLGNSDICIG